MSLCAIKLCRWYSNVWLLTNCQNAPIFKDECLNPISPEMERFTSLSELTISMLIDRCRRSTAAWNDAWRMTMTWKRCSLDVWPGQLALCLFTTNLWRHVTSQHSATSFKLNIDAFRVIIENACNLGLSAHCCWQRLFTIMLMVDRYKEINKGSP